MHFALFLTFLLLCPHPTLSRGTRRKPNAPNNSFLPVGSFSNGIATAHLHFKINLTQVRLDHESLQQVLTRTNQTLILKVPKNKVAAVNRLMQRTQQRLTPSKEVLAQVSTWFPQSATRSKRQAIAAAAVLGVLDFGLSLYTLHELHELQRRVAAGEEAEQHIISTINDQGQAIKTNAKNIIHLNRTCSQLLGRVQDLQLSSYVTSVNDALVSAIEVFEITLVTWAEGLSSIIRGSLDPRMLTAEQLRASFAELKQQAERRGYKLLEDSVTSLFRHPISYLAAGDILTVFVHIPIARRTPLHLYRHVPVPVDINGQAIQVTSGQDNTFLAVDRELKFGIELSASELQTCERGRDSYICPKAAVLRRNIRQSCLGAIFLGDAAEMRARCTIHLLDHDDERVFAVNQTSFAVFTPKATFYTVTCPPSYHPVNLRLPSGLSFHSVNPACSAQTAEHVFRPQEDLSIEGRFLELPFRPVQAEALITPFTGGELSTALQELRAVKDPRTRTLAQVATYLKERKERSDDRLRVFLDVSAAVGCSISTGLIIWLLGVACRRRRHRAMSDA